MRLLISTLITFFSLISCTRNDLLDGKEPATLNEDQFIAVYEEILVVESYYQAKLGLPHLCKKELETASGKIFLKYKTNKTQFEKSFEYYALDPKRLQSIQEKIINRLNKRKL